MMRPALPLLIATWLPLAVGCQQPATGPATRPATQRSELTVDCPEHTDVRDMPLGRGATYRAEQHEGFVIIRASGRNPTAGWTNLLSVSPLRIYPQQFEFHQQAPDGMAAQVITDYSTCLKWRTNDRFAELVVRDADGQHRVKVEPQMNADERR